MFVERPWCRLVLGSPAAKQSLSHRSYPGLKVSNFNTECLVCHRACDLHLLQLTQQTILIVVFSIVWCIYISNLSVQCRVKSIW